MAYRCLSLFLLLSVLTSNKVYAETSLPQHQGLDQLVTGSPHSTPSLSQLCQDFSGVSHNRTASPIDVDGKATNITATIPACFPVADLTTHTSSQITDDSYTNYLRDIFQLALLVSWYFRVVIYPIVGVLGITGNILSLLVLVRSGFAKPSNIFLLGLAVADSFCLLGAVNIATIIRYTPRSLPFGVWLWEFSESSSFACFVFATTCECLSSYGMYVSSGLCVAITLERCLAVYLPLQFTNLVTPTRAWIVCSCIFLFWTPYLVFTGISWYRFDYSYRSSANTQAGDMLYVRIKINESLDYYFAALFGKFIPLAIVIIGSIMITIKVMITMRRRQKMVSSSSSKAVSSGSRTTTTMLMVCAVFTVAKIVTLPSYGIDFTDMYMWTMSVYLGLTVFLCDYINSSVNFLIYVLINNKFRLVLVEIFSGKRRSK